MRSYDQAALGGDEKRGAGSRGFPFSTRSPVYSGPSPTSTI